MDGRADFKQPIKTSFLCFNVLQILRENKSTATSAINQNSVEMMHTKSKSIDVKKAAKCENPCAILHLFHTRCTSQQLYTEYKWPTIMLKNSFHCFLKKKDTKSCHRLSPRNAKGLNLQLDHRLLNRDTVFVYSSKAKVIREQGLFACKFCIGKYIDADAAILRVQLGNYPH